jgi:hypothetical protein
VKVLVYTARPHNQPALAFDSIHEQFFTEKSLSKVEEGNEWGNNATSREIILSL